MKKPEWINQIKAIGWDLDGTLYPPNSIPSKVIQDMQYQAVAQANSWSLKKTQQQFKNLYNQLGSHTKTLSALGVNGNNFFTNLWNELPLEKYLKPDEKIIKLFSQIPLKRHFLVTNSNTRVQVDRKLNLIGLNPEIFEVIITTDKITSVKPDPQPFNAALRVLALNPSQTLFVGDRVTTDIRGANNLGMKTCLVWSQSIEADICFEDVYQVSKLYK